MNAITLLREQLKSAHELLESTVGDTPDTALHASDTGKALPAGAAYAHSIISEDVIVAGILTHTTPLSSDNSKTGLSVPMPSFSEWDKNEAWVKQVKVDLPKLQEFAKGVYEVTDAYIASLSEDDLDKEIEIPGMGTHTMSSILSSFIILHIANLTGEISAAKGIQGLKGYPF
jgi:hypothetical protein